MAERPIEQPAQLFRTLMHPARLEILTLLRDGEACVCHLEAALGYRQAYVSQHLSVLRQAGLVHDRRDGWNIFYEIAEPRILVLIDQARAICGVSERVARLPRPLAACPCPTCVLEVGGETG